ncbi:unnamed protein product [Bursaphelenchus xylophilus]|uniref:(pine wood nematode) hypothetical protein n=1 Tax=Bursaphelenchus xylophilus TaxID=6326 RepID=A0A1I7RW11_BURXY|nr:unnamed protein product [Bursaphelenchus xylophilus]CAG9094990.1 unnamed protein product [Bursaphelenchus xylophilus]
MCDVFPTYADLYPYPYSEHHHSCTYLPTTSQPQDGRLLSVDGAWSCARAHSLRSNGSERRRKLARDQWPLTGHMDDDDDQLDELYDSSQSPSPQPYYHKNIARGASPVNVFHPNPVNAASSGISSSCSTNSSTNGYALTINGHENSLYTSNNENHAPCDVFEDEKLSGSQTDRCGNLLRNQQMRSFNVDSQGRIVDCGFRRGRPSRPLTRNNKTRRATCPEIWLSSADDEYRPVTRCVLRLYGSPNVGKKTLAKQMSAHADITACTDLNGMDFEDVGPASTIAFMMNENEVQLEIIQGSALESAAFEDVMQIYMVVYSVDSRESFIRAAQILYRLHDTKRRGPKLPVILIGNKVDLQRKRRVSFIEGRMLAKIYKSAFVEASSLLSMNMDQVWEETLKKLQKCKMAQERQLQCEEKGKGGNRLMGRIFKRGRRFAKSCEEIVARLASL